MFTRAQKGFWHHYCTNSRFSTTRHCLYCWQKTCGTKRYASAAQELRSQALRMSLSPSTNIPSPTQYQKDFAAWDLYQVRCSWCFCGCRVGSVVWWVTWLARHRRDSFWVAASLDIRKGNIRAIDRWHSLLILCILDPDLQRDPTCSEKAASSQG